MPLKALEVGCAQLKGDRPYQQDRYTFHSETDASKKYALFMVLDGHGTADYAQHAKNHLEDCIVQSEAFRRGNYAQAIYEGFAAEDQAMREEIYKANHTRGGTTATIALIADEMIYVGNVGDSLAIVGEREFESSITVHPVTPKDSLKNREEFIRVSQTGAKITRKGRISRAGHSLNMTRALGDFYLKAPETRHDWITSIPHVSLASLVPFRSEFLVIASDGLWNVMDEEQVVEVIGANLDKGRAPKDVAEYLARRVVESVERSDNVTVLLVVFDWG
jgi:serine/threonine protein phosphatase PrpC